MRNRALIRVLRLAEHLRGGRCTLEQLAARFDVSTRTVRRDLEALSIAGIPVRTNADAAANGFDGYWWVERNG